MKHYITIATLTLWVLLGMGCASQAKRGEPLTDVYDLAAQYAGPLQIQLELAPPATVRVVEESDSRLVDMGLVGPGPKFAWRVRVVDLPSRQQLPQLRVDISLFDQAGDFLASQPLAPILSESGLSYIAYSDALPDGDYRAEVAVDTSPLTQSPNGHAGVERLITKAFRFSLDAGLVRDKAMVAQVAPDLPRRDGKESWLSQERLGELDLRVAAKAQKPGRYALSVQLSDGPVDVAIADVAVRRDGRDIPLQLVWSKQGLRYQGEVAAKARERLTLRATPARIDRFASMTRFDQPVEMRLRLPEAKSKAGMVYALRLGVFGNQANVRRAIKNLKRAGVGGFATDLNVRGRALEQLFAGPFPSKAAARGAIGKVKKLTRLKGSVKRVCYPPGASCR